VRNVFGAAFRRALSAPRTIDEHHQSARLRSSSSAFVSSGSFESNVRRVRRCARPAAVPRRQVRAGPHRWTNASARACLRQRVRPGAADRCGSRRFFAPTRRPVSLGNLTLKTEIGSSGRTLRGGSPTRTARRGACSARGSGDAPALQLRRAAAKLGQRRRQTGDRSAAA
jgi:hypothetical protein